MQTRFALAQLADSKTADSERILRSCVHCGFCTATCPTYLLLGDELDSPRGRIYLIKDMLEGGKPASPEVVTHIDRCLSCLSCMTTCPSGVNYMHLVDHARAHIAETFRRPLPDRWLRGLYAAVLPHPNRFRWALRAARLAKPLRPLFAAIPGVGRRLAASLALAPARPLPEASRGQSAGIRIRTGTRAPVGVPSPAGKVDEIGAPVPNRALGASGTPRRVALLTGCAQQVLRPSINEATLRLLARQGVEAVPAPGEGCCGALVHHLGREAAALTFAKANIDAWIRQIEAGGLDAILITASGCGTTVKDYGFMLREDPAYAAKAARVAALAKDITEYLAGLNPAPPIRRLSAPIAYHSACSMQHGQKITDLPKVLLRQAGFVVRDVPEGHICCGSAGTYNLLQPELAQRLRDRKLANIEKTDAVAVATGNIGCMTQLASGTGLPLVHTVELLDWAQGGPSPPDWTVPERLVAPPAEPAGKRTVLAVALAK